MELPDKFPGKSTTKLGPVVALHGYGVRDRFWRYLEPHLSRICSEFHAVNLDMTTIDSARRSATEACRIVVAHNNRPIVVLGHSLGGVLAALTAQELGSNFISHVCIIAAPFGDREVTSLGATLGKFLLRFRLIPAALARPRFFSALTPAERQKELFRDAVPESRELQELLFTPRWFHSDLIQPIPEIPYLVILSEADKVVPSHESVAFAERLRAQTRIFDKGRGVGHDDFAAAPSVLPEICEILHEFATTSRGIT